MRTWLLVVLLVLVVSACGPGGSAQVPTNELPDPAIYALTLGDLPDVGASWQQSYDQTTTEQGYKWSYRAYQAYQPPGPGGLLESAFAINNDVILYEVDMRRQDLPQPPQSLGNISAISWKPAAQLHRLGDKSAVWKTTIGDLFTPVWWLEFYEGHAYVRISLFGFPDELAQPVIYNLADSVAKRLPSSVDTLRSDAATPAPTRAPLPTATLIETLPPQSSPAIATPSPQTTP